MINIEMTTKQIEAITGKRHNNILRDVREQLTPALAVLKIEHGFYVEESTYIGKDKVERPMFILGKGAVNMLMCNYSMEHAGMVMQYVYQLEEENRNLRDRLWEMVMLQAHTSVQFGCKAVGIEHPNKFMEFVRNGEQLDSLVEKGYFEWRNYGQKYGSHLKLTPKGMDWLFTKHETFNTLTKDKMNAQKVEREAYK